MPGKNGPLVLHKEANLAGMLLAHRSIGRAVMRVILIIDTIQSGLTQIGEVALHAGQQRVVVQALGERERGCKRIFLGYV